MQLHLPILQGKCSQKWVDASHSLGKVCMYVSEYLSLVILSALIGILSNLVVWFGMFVCMWVGICLWLYGPP